MGTETNSGRPLFIRPVRLGLFRTAGLAAALVTILAGVVTAQSGPALLHPDLNLRTVVTGLVTPTSIAFLGKGNFFVLEKDTGKVKRVVNGVVNSTVLDLSVNFGSERGLLGIALHPDFPSNPGVYLYWSCRSTAAPADPFFPDEQRCLDANMFGPDSDDLLRVPLLGNRVDRFVWNGSTLQYDRNLIMLRSFQNDGAPVPPNQGDDTQIARGNHDGGVIAFGPDRKLYVLLGDVGRRGQLQNLPSGPTLTGLGPVVPDDQFGGPQPDDAHFTGVILRLNDNGSTPTDNPFFAAGAAIGGEVGANIQKIFVYGIRNSFGMAFDPRSGHLWFQENGEDAFDEISRARPGMNSGWIQIAGPAERVPEYKAIETTALHHEDFPNLQQFRWGPERIANTAAEALARLSMLPGARYIEPEFSWKHVLAPSAMGFASRRGLGSEFEGDLFVGCSLPEPLGGPLFRFQLKGNRRAFDFEDDRLKDRVADNITFHDMTESESLLIGTNFGVVTDIETGPNGNLFVVSLSQGAVYEIRARERDDEDEEDVGGDLLVAVLTGVAEVPGPGDRDGSGIALITLDRKGERVCFELSVFDIAPATAAHIHRGEAGEAGPVVVTLSPPPSSGTSNNCVSADKDLIKEIRKDPEEFYVNVHNAEFPDGAVRGQLF